MIVELMAKIADLWYSGKCLVLNCLFHLKTLSLRGLHADASFSKQGGGDRHISNGVFLRFGFDSSKS